MTEEAVLQRFAQHKCNVDLMIEFLTKQGVLDHYKHDVILWKKHCRDQLFPYYSNAKYKKLWRNTYPEINRLYLTDKQNNWRSKINFIMDYIGLHNIWSIIIEKTHM